MVYLRSMEISAAGPTLSSIV